MPERISNEGLFCWYEVRLWAHLFLWRYRQLYISFRPFFMVHVNGLLLSFLWAQLLQFLKNAEMSIQSLPMLLKISTYSWYSLSQKPIVLVFAWNSSRISFVLFHISLVSIVEKLKSFFSWLHHFSAPSHSTYWKSMSYVKKVGGFGWHKQKCVPLLHVCTQET